MMISAVSCGVMGLDILFSWQLAVGSWQLAVGKNFKDYRCFKNYFSFLLNTHDCQLINFF
jgi:hypothetical protein